MANLYIYPKAGNPRPTRCPRDGDDRAGRHQRHRPVRPVQLGPSTPSSPRPTGATPSSTRAARTGRSSTAGGSPAEIDLARGDEILIGSTSFFFDRDRNPVSPGSRGRPSPTAPTPSSRSRTCSEAGRRRRGHEDSRRGPRLERARPGPTDPRGPQRGQPGPHLPHAPGEAVRPHHGVLIRHMPMDRGRPDAQGSRSPGTRAPGRPARAKAPERTRAI